MTAVRLLCVAFATTSGARLAHAPSTMTLSTACSSLRPNPQTPLLDFAANCPPDSDRCWPLLYLLGVQKAATTGVTARASHDARTRARHTIQTAVLCVLCR